MEKIILTDTLEMYVPKDPNDKALLSLAPGSTFKDTTLPSGYTTPDEDLICLAGILFPLKQIQALDSLNGHKKLTLNTELTKIFGPQANVQTLIAIYKKFKGS